MDRLENTIRPYAWGSTTAIPELLGTEPTGQPQAELWLGAHPGAPSHVDRGAGPLSLADAIAADPTGELGAPVVRAFGARLPFLLKVLAADVPLSLQVHPDLRQAQAGFADEEARGVPVDAPHRTYRDANHKPELICALTPFDGLCGFRSPTETAALLEELGVDELKPHADLLRTHPEADALREVLTAVLTADPTAMAETVSRVARAARDLAARESGRFRDTHAATVETERHFPGDPGVIAALMLNHVRLQPGQALYLGAGVPHAYLSGLGVEIMANSDNVLRCGLTPKHIDVPELLRVVRFEHTEPAVLHPTTVTAREGEELYAAPTADFRLSRYVLAADDRPRALDDRAAQILLCTEGSARVRSVAGPGGEEAELTLRRGESAYVRAGEPTTLSGSGTVFRATVTV
ncbi:mannose-6-phosphate isomerase, class I [Streptomyces sp. 4N509B]|uniref:mannose-6-phosphate isomerase, class I n=1 Tax=Streptomyces sp. 4N509B TaxID=3457413 RepID=UPI003FD52D0E